MVNRVVGQTRAGKMRSKGQCSRKKGHHQPHKDGDIFPEESASFLCNFTRCSLFFIASPNTACSPLPLHLITLMSHMGNGGSKDKSFSQGQFGRRGGGRGRLLKTYSLGLCVHSFSGVLVIAGLLSSFLVPTIYWAGLPVSSWTTSE